MYHINSTAAQNIDIDDKAFLKNDIDLELLS